MKNTIKITVMACRNGDPVEVEAQLPVGVAMDLIHSTATRLTDLALERLSEQWPGPFGQRMV